MSRYRSTGLIPTTDPGYVAWKNRIEVSSFRRRESARAARAASSPRFPASTPIAAPDMKAYAAEPSVSRDAAVVVPAPSVMLPVPAAARTAPPLEISPLAAGPTPPVVEPAVSDPLPYRAHFGRDAEYVIRRSLRSELPVSDRRVLRFSECVNGQWRTTYRELDVVAFVGRRLYVFEVKATSRVDAIRKGVAQLRLVRDVLAGSFFDVVTTLVVVDTTGLLPEHSPLASHLRTSSCLTPVASCSELTSAPVIHVLTRTPQSIQELAPFRIDLSFLHVA